MNIYNQRICKCETLSFIIRNKGRKTMSEQAVILTREGLKQLEQICIDQGLMKSTGNVDYKAIKKATGIPDRTLRSWFSGEREPSPWVINLLKFYFTAGGFR